MLQLMKKIADGKGGFITCKADCKSCSKTRCGRPDSLETEQEINGFEVTNEPENDMEKKTLQIAFEELLSDLRKKSPHLANVFEGMLRGKTNYEIGLDLGKAESTIQEQTALLMTIIREFLT